MKKILILSVCIFSFFIAESQTTIDGEIRPRAEYRYGYQKLPDTLDFAMFTSQRTRLNLHYKKEKLSTKISLQDIRVWGDEALKSDVASIGLSEGWAEWQLADSISLKIGRQYLIYDNQRLMSNNNWKQTGQSHDAVVVKIKYQGFDIHLGTAFNNDKEKVYNQTYVNLENYKTLNYLWLSKSFNPNIKTSVIAISDGFEKSDNYKVIYLRETFGGNIEVEYNPVGVNLRAYYQMGKYKGIDVKAFYINPEFYCKINNLKILLGAEYLSGQDNLEVEKGKSKVFNTLYGTAHAFNGYLDYFTNFNPDNIKHDTKGVGLLDNYLKFKFKISQKSSIEADAHYFMLPNDYHYDISDSSKVAKPHLGTELDLTYKYDYSKNISLSVGYSAMLGTETLKYLKGGNEKKLASWAYIMITFKPVFFSKD